MSESSSSLADGLEVLGVGVLAGRLGGPVGHAGTGYLSGGRKLLTCFCGGPGRGARCGQQASKQAGKAPRTQGHPLRTKRFRIRATLKQNKHMYKNTSGYVYRWVTP